MPHHFFDIGVIILLASLSAIFLSKFKQLPMIGYVVAGVILGPAGLRVIEDQSEIHFIAEIGVILLLFILGMELPLNSFRKSYKVAIPATLSLIALSLAMVFVVGFVADLSFEEKIVYAFIISLSSTAVAVKLLDNLDLLSKGTGQIAVSILIAQDLLFVPMIMITNAMGSAEGISLAFLPKIAIAGLLLVGLIAYLSRKEKIELLFASTVRKHEDLIPVASLAWCFVGAGLSEYAGLSPAYGAFIAGMIIGNSHSKERVLPKIEPMQNVMLMVFFLSIGMLIDFTVIMNNMLLIAALLVATMLFKTVACITLLKLFLPADRWRCSFVTGLTISQVGEFSFIIAAAALGNGIFDEESYKVIIAVVALSLAFSPIWMMILNRFVQITFIDKSARVLTKAIAMSFNVGIKAKKSNP